MITPYGIKQVYKYALLSFVAIIVCIFFGGLISPSLYWLTIIPILELGFVLYFFRDPERTITDNVNALVAPADGVITHMEECEDPGELGGRAYRISIFLSVFNVHINRTAFQGTVTKVKYKEGEFLNALNHDSLHRNECNDVTFNTKDARLPKYTLRQIAGLIARRIDCDVKEGDVLEKGQRYGMMKFSSRTDFFIPIETKLDFKVKIGDKVRAGSDILAELI